MSPARNSDTCVQIQGLGPTKSADQICSHLSTRACGELVRVLVLVASADWAPTMLPSTGSPADDSFRREVRINVREGLFLRAEEGHRGLGAERAEMGRFLRDLRPDGKRCTRCVWRPREDVECMTYLGKTHAVANPACRQLDKRK